MNKIVYGETDASGLDLISSLWKKLIEYHRVRSPSFTGHYGRVTWDKRKKKLLEKSKSGAIRIDLAREGTSGTLVGYCVSTISKEKQGEIESLYVEEHFRRCGIGDNLVINALKWMDSNTVIKKIVGVGVGNEEVFEFYRRYNFYPRTMILEQVDNNRKGA